MGFFWKLFKGSVKVAIFPATATLKVASFSAKTAVKTVAFSAGAFLVAGKVVAGTVKGTYLVASALADLGNLSAQTPSRQIDPKRTFSEIKGTNNELQEIWRKEQKDKCLSKIESDRKIALESKREHLYHDYESYKHYQIIQAAQSNPQRYDQFPITSENAHIFQYHVGETVLGKKCYKCQRPMVLQFRRNQMIIIIDDLFWACTGWYYGECNVTQNFVIADVALLDRNDKEEFHITNQKFAEILQTTSIQDTTIRRVRKHQRENIDDYVCPTHKEPLILREKREDTGILDKFFLGCPRWTPQGGCTYVLKLKSPAQLASFLDKTEARGIL